MKHDGISQYVVVTAEFVDRFIRPDARPEMWIIFDTEVLAVKNVSKSFGGRYRLWVDDGAGGAVLNVEGRDQIICKF